MAAGYLRTVIAENRLRLAELPDRPVQYPRDSPTGEAGVNFQRMALFGEAIKNAEDAKTSAGCRYIAGEIDRPLLARRSQDRPWLQGASKFLAPIAFYAQLQFAIHALYLLVVDCDLFASQQHMQAPITEPRMFPRQTLEPLA